MENCDKPITAEELAELKRLADAATPGPWTAEKQQGGQIAGWPRQWVNISHRKTLEMGQTYAKIELDAAFIAAARTAVPRLIAALADKDAEIDALRQTNLLHQKSALESGAEIVRLQAEAAAVRREMIRAACDCCNDPTPPVCAECPTHHALSSDAGKALLSRLEKLERDRRYAIPALEEIARQFGKCMCHEEQCGKHIALELAERFAALDGKEGE